MVIVNKYFCFSLISHYPLLQWYETIKLKFWEILKTDYLITRPKANLSFIKNKSTISNE